MSNIIHLHQLSEHAAANDREADTPLQEASLFVPSGEISCFEIDASEIPARYLQQALPPLLEDLIADELDNIHVSHGKHNKNVPLPVLISKPQTLQEWIDTAISSGIQAIHIFADFYSVKEPKNDTIHVHINDDYAITRLSTHQGFSATTEETLSLLAHISQNKKVVIFSDKPLESTKNLTFSIESPDTEPPSLDNAINLRQGPFVIQKRRKTNPYKPFMWPIVLTAVLMLALCLNFVAQTHYYKQQNIILSQAVKQDYQRVFGKVPEGNWQQSARYLNATARAQLEGSQLGHWKLIKQLNNAISSCRSCVIEEITINNQSVLLSLKQEGSQSLVSIIKEQTDLKIEDEQKTQNTITLKLKHMGA